METWKTLNKYSKCRAKCWSISKYLLYNYNPNKQQIFFSFTKDHKHRIYIMSCFTNLRRCIQWKICGGFRHFLWGWTKYAWFMIGDSASGGGDVHPLAPFKQPAKVKITLNCIFRVVWFYFKSIKMSTCQKYSVYIQSLSTSLLV